MVSDNKMLSGIYNHIFRTKNACGEKINCPNSSMTCSSKQCVWQKGKKNLELADKLSKLKSHHAIKYNK